MKIKIQRVEKGAVIPEYAHDGDAGFDLITPYTIYLTPGVVTLIETGIKMEIPKGYEVQIRSKSGLALKDIIVVNSPGTIDSNYRGEIGVILKNNGQYIYKLEKGNKIAQAVLKKVETAQIVEVKKLNETVRGEGGYGSTGK